MDTTPVTYDTFWTIFMRQEASLVSMVRVARDFSSRRSLRSKVAMIFMVLTMVLILVFPTLAGAMTGYASRSGSFIADQKGNLSPFAQFTPVLYFIHDGWRIGLDGNQPVPYQKIASGKTPDPIISRPY